jgi:hypothetical protein
MQVSILTFLHLMNDKVLQKSVDDMCVYMFHLRF